MSTAPTAPAKPVHSVITKLLAGLNGAFSNPNDAGLMGFAQGMLAASQPHMLTPVSMGQALGMGMQGAQAYRQASLANAIQQEAALPFQKARTATFVKSLAGSYNPNLTPVQRASDQSEALQFAGIDPAKVPWIAQQLTRANQTGSLHPVPANTRLVWGNGQPLATAQGALPTGTQQGPGGTVSTMPGAPQAIASNAANTAGAAAAATYPYQAGLSYHTRAPGTAGATLGPRPGPFVPVGAANPAAAMRRTIGVEQGLASSAQAAGRPGPFAPPMPTPNTGAAGLGGATTAPAPLGTLAARRQFQESPAGRAQFAAQANAAARGYAAGVPAAAGAPRSTLGLPAGRVGAAPAPGGGGIYSQGMTPAQVAMSAGQGKQAVDMNAGYQKQAEDAKDMLAQLQGLAQDAHNFAPGQFAEARVKGLQWLQSVGLITPAEMNHLGSAQEGAKMTIQLQSAFTKSLGSREAAQIFATLGRGVPNLTMSPDGFAKVSAYMAGMARYNMLRAEHAQTYFNAGNIKGVNSVRDQFIGNTNPAYFIIASAPPVVQREMIAAMGTKARPFLERWQKAINSGWAPEPDAYGNAP